MKFIFPWESLQRSPRLQARFVGRKKTEKIEIGWDGKRKGKEKRTRKEERTGKDWE